MIITLSFFASVLHIYFWLKIDIKISSPNSTELNSQEMEQIIEKLKKTVTKDSFTDDEIDLVVQVDYSWDIARAILSSPTPADNLDVVIDLHYHYGFDWGYPKDLIDYFKGVEVLEGNIPQKQALLQLLYNGLYLTKHETLDKNQALCLAHNYFPKEEQNKLTLYLNNYV